MPDANTFAARLAMIRHQMGWNLKEAALACGFPPGSWREWELHARNPRGLAEIAERIAERTGVDEYWLMTGKLPPTEPIHPHPGLPHSAQRRARGGPKTLPRLDSNQQPFGYWPVGNDGYRTGHVVATMLLQQAG